MAHFAGREPGSYLLDPRVKVVPGLPLGDEDPLGRHVCASPLKMPAGGRRFEPVAQPDGGAFDLLGMIGRQDD
jgi:hypothetical protein